MSMDDFIRQARQRADADEAAAAERKSYQARGEQRIRDVADRYIRSIDSVAPPSEKVEVDGHGDGWFLAGLGSTTDSIDHGGLRGYEYFRLPAAVVWARTGGYMRVKAPQYRDQDLSGYERVPDGRYVPDGLGPQGDSEQTQLLVNIFVSPIRWSDCGRSWEEPGDPHASASGLAANLDRRLESLGINWI